MTKMSPHRRDDWKGPDEGSGGCLGMMLAMVAVVLAAAAALLG